MIDDAGARIPEDPFTSVQSGFYKFCKTSCPGYLPSGSHPQNPGELVENVKVCYNCDGGMCSYSNHVVKIRNCGDFFVYYLTQPRIKIISYIRYCTE